MTEVFSPPGTDAYQESEDSIPKRPGNGPLSVSLGIMTAYQPEKFIDQGRNLQQIVFNEAIVIACDWCEATSGEAISEEVIQNLYDNGYASSTPAEILEIFYDWDDYQAVAQSYFDEREDPEDSRRLLVEALRQEAELGLIPDIFFTKSETHKIENPSGKNKLTRHTFTDEQAPDDIVLQRYHKYLVTDYVTRNRDHADEITEDRKISIALGFTQETGKPLSSFFGSLKNSNGSLTDEQITLAIEDLNAYDYIYPDSRKNHLQTLVDNGRSNPNTTELEYYYDLKLKKIILLGRSALKFVSESEGVGYLEKLQEQRKLIVGKRAVNAYAKGAEKNTVVELDTLLRDEGTIEYETIQKRSIDSDLSREEIIEYANWLISVIGSQETGAAKDLSEKIIKKAYKLGIGPSSQQVARRVFSSLTELYETLDRTNLHFMGQFDDWPREKFVDYLKSTGADLGRTPTLSDLLNLARADRKKPSPYKIANELGSLTQGYKEAGFEVYGNGKSFIKKGLIQQ